LSCFGLRRSCDSGSIVDHVCWCAARKWCCQDRTAGDVRACIQCVWIGQPLWRSYIDCCTRCCCCFCTWRVLVQPATEQQQPELCKVQLRKELFRSSIGQLATHPKDPPSHESGSSCTFFVVACLKFHVVLILCGRRPGLREPKSLHTPVSRRRLDRS